jgi:hypothetical protein
MAVKDETSDSLLHALAERFRNPVFFSFLISWVYFNWRALYVTLFVSVKELPFKRGTRVPFHDKLAYLASLDVSIWKPVAASIAMPIILYGAGEGVKVATEWLMHGFTSIRHSLFEHRVVPYAKYAKVLLKKEKLESALIEADQRTRDVAALVDGATRDLAQKEDARKNLEEERDDARQELMDVRRELNDANSKRTELASTVSSLYGNRKRAIAEQRQLLDQRSAHFEVMTEAINRLDDRHAAMEVRNPLSTLIQVDQDLRQRWDSELEVGGAHVG